MEHTLEYLEALEQGYRSPPRMEVPAWLAEELAEKRAAVQEALQQQWAGRGGTNGTVSGRMVTGCRWVDDDGGRAAAGFKGKAGDCVTRAFTIARFGPQPSGEQYMSVYTRLGTILKVWAFEGRVTAAKRPYREGRRSVTPRNGMPAAVSDAYGEELGWPKWTKPFGPTVLHLVPGELPSGTLVCGVSRHLCAVIDGVLYDTHDAGVSRHGGPGKRAVSSYWTKT